MDGNLTCYNLLIDVLSPFFFFSAPKKEAPKAKAKVAPAPAPAAAAAPAPVKAPAPPAKLPGLRPEENAGTMYEMGSMYGSQAAFTENAGTMYTMNPVGMVRRCLCLAFRHDAPHVAMPMVASLFLNVMGELDALDAHICQMGMLTRPYTVRFQ